MFFQEESGIIRDAIYEGENWGAPTSYVVATDARNNTPLAAFNVPPGTDVSDERVSVLGFPMQGAPQKYCKWQDVCLEFSLLL